MMKLAMHRITASFTQEGNTLGTTDGIEELEITLDSQEALDEPGSSFIVLKTTTGWSIDSVDELNALVVRLKKAI
jgi:hypothetical protein